MVISKSVVGIAKLIFKRTELLSFFSKRVATMGKFPIPIFYKAELLLNSNAKWIILRSCGTVEDVLNYRVPLQLLRVLAMHVLHYTIYKFFSYSVISVLLVIFCSCHNWIHFVRIFRTSPLFFFVLSTNKPHATME